MERNVTIDLRKHKISKLEMMYMNELHLSKGLTGDNKSSLRRRIFVIHLEQSTTSMNMLDSFVSCFAFMMIFIFLQSCYQPKFFYLALLVFSVLSYLVLLFFISLFRANRLFGQIFFHGYSLSFSITSQTLNIIYMSFTQWVR